MVRALQRSAEEVERALGVVRARQQREVFNPLQEVLEWLADTFGIQAMVEIWEGFFWILLGALVVLALWTLARLLGAGGRRRGAAAIEEAAPDLGERIARLLREAAEARERGELRLALRRQLFALLLGLGGRGDLEYRDAWTNRELLRRGHPSPEALALLRPLVEELEAKEFGGAEVTPADLARVESLTREHLELVAPIAAGGAV